MLTPRHCWRWFSVFALAVDRFVRLRVALLSLFGLVCCFVLVCLAPWRLNGLCIDPYSVLLLGHIVIWECCHCINSLNLPICISFPNGLTTWRELQGVGRKKKEEGFKAAWWGLQKDFRGLQEGFGKVWRGFEQGSKGAWKAFERVALPDHLRLKPITWATHLGPSLPSTMPCSKFWFLFKLPLPAFHNAMI